jgi:hypothetical protein
MLSFLMIQNVTIPSPDPMPLPAPVWLLKFLLLLTLFLHLLAMNCALGGGVLALLAELRGRANAHAQQLARDIARMLPIFIAFTITLGVAPLLFVQVLYGHLLYTSSILLGGAWILIILLLLAGYYGYYYFSLRGEARRQWALPVAALSALFFAAIGFIFANNMTLMLVPERWAAIYRADPSGWNLNLADATVIPRYLHFLIASFAVSGLLLVILGVVKLRKQADYGRWTLQQGAWWFAIATVVQYGAGIWFLVALPRPVRMLFLGEDAVATTTLAVAVVLSLVALLLVLYASMAEKPLTPSGAGIALLLITVFLMVLMRDIVRTAYLQPHFELSSLQVAPQMGVIALFLVLFLAGLATLFYMLRKVVTARGVS